MNNGIRFGYRLKVPLALAVVALVSGIIVSATTYMLVDRHVEANAEAETRRLAGTLARRPGDPSGRRRCRVDRRRLAAVLTRRAWR